MRTRAAMVCLLAFGWLTASLADPITLKFAMSPGEVQSYDVSVKMKADASSGKGAGSEEMDVDITIKLGYMLKCISAEENQFTCEARFYDPEAACYIATGGQLLEMLADTSGMKLRQDGKTIKSMTWEEAGKTDIPHFGHLVKLRLRCVLGSHGELIDILDKDSLESDFPNFPFDQMMGHQIVYPDGPVEIGDTWTSIVDMNMAEGFLDPTNLGTVSTRFTYMLKRVGMYNGVKCAVIGLSGVTSSGPESETTVNMESEGDIVVDIANGRVMIAKISADETLSGRFGGQDMDVTTTAGIILKYTGSGAPKEALEQDILDAVGPELINALNELRVPIITREKIKIGEDFYALNDDIEIAGSTLRLVKYSDDVVYLKESETGTVFRLVFNFKGQVRKVTPIAANK